jgi:hypothetical protein
LKDAAEITGGRLAVGSQKGKGTVLDTVFVISSIDRLPLGDVAETLVSTIAAKPDTDYELNVSSWKGEFCFGTQDVRQRLGDLPVNNFEVLLWIMDYINEGVAKFWEVY